MPTYFRFNSLKKFYFILPALLFVVVSFGQSVILPGGNQGVREELHNLDVGSTITLKKLVPGEFYTLSLSQDGDCYPIIGFHSPNSGTMIQDDHVIQLHAEKSNIEIIIKDWVNCDVDRRKPILISANCETCVDKVAVTEGDEGDEKMMNLETSLMAAQALIQDVFIGGGCFDVTNVTAAGSFGYFTSGQGSVGFADGIILSSGSITTAPGPNNAEGTSGGAAGGSDTDLAQLTTSNVIEHTVIEFDFRPTIDVVQFAYSFASEEYCEWVNSSFNDVFGFFISGPGIAGPYTNAAENIAQLPDGTPVTINNVNHLTNSGFFVGSNGSCGVAANPNISFDGYTVPLVAQSAVIPCETYHIRLVVGDAGDGIFDSAVFLGGNTFKAGSLGAIQADIPGLSADFQGVAVEDCGNGNIIFNRVGTLDGDIVIPLSINPLSTATPGVDYTALPPVVIIPEGLPSVTVPFSVFQDFIVEGVETIIVDMESSCNCSVTSFIINITDAIPLALVGEEVDFCASENVTFTANPSGGAPTYEYEWNTNPPQYGQTIGVSPTETTTYTVTVTDDCDNTITADYTVEVAAIVSATMSGNVEICGEFDQVEVPVVLQGPGPWTLEYAHNSVTQPVITNIFDNPYTLTFTEPGVYNLVSIMSGGCGGGAFGQVIVEEGELTFASDVTPLSCNGQNDGSITVLPFSEAGGYSYVWQGSTNGSNTLSGLTPGTYYVTMTDGVGCSNDAQFTLDAPIPPNIVSIVPTDANCSFPFGSIDLTLTEGNGGPLTVVWDQGIGEVEDPTNLPPGTYTATITDEGGCELFAFETIDGDFTPPEIAVSEDGLISCLFDSATLSGAGSSSGSNFSYSWTNSGGTEVSTDLEYTTMVPDTYTLEVTNATNGCTIEDQVTIAADQTDPVAAIAAPDQLNCTVLQVALNGDGSTGANGLDYTWYNGAVEIGTGSEINVGDAGSYTLVVTDQVNGCTDNVIIGVTQNIIPPTSDAGLDGFLTCDNNEATLTGSGSSSSGAFTYQWVNEGNVEIGITPSVTVNAAGTYTLIITDSDNGCTAENDAVVAPDADLPIVAVSSSGVITCDNNVATISSDGSSSDANFSYQWFAPDNTPLTTDPNATVNQDGVYLLEITNTDNGCVAEGSVLVPLDNIAPAVEAGNDGLLTCTEDMVELQGTSADDTNGDFEYEWFDENSMSVGNLPDLEVTQAGTYTLQVTGNNGCVNTDQAIVDLDNDVPAADAGAPGVITCVIEDLELGGPGTSTDAGLQYTWTNADGDVVGNSINYTATGEGTYTLEVFNPTNQCLTSDNVIVTENVEYPTVDLGNPADLDCDVMMTELGGTGTSSGTEYDYTWTNGDGDVVSNDAIFMTSEPGDFTLLVVNTLNDCEVTDNISVEQDIENPEAAAGPDLEFDCQTDELDLSANTSGNNSNTEYAWFDENNVEVSSDPDFSTMNIGTYTLVVTNPDNNCEATDELVVGTAVDVPVADAGPAAEINCTVESVTLGGSGTSTDPGLQYTWTDEDGDEVANTASFSTEDEGSYTLLVYNPANDCSSTDLATVTTSVDIPEIDVAANGQLNCDILSYQLGGSGSSSGTEFSYQWTNEDGDVVSTDPNFETNEPGMFTFLIVNTTNDCEIDAQVEVTQDNEAPLANAGLDANIDCLTASIDLAADQTQSSSNISYTWYDENNVEVSNTANYSTNMEGTYTLVVVNSDNMCEETDEVVVANLIDIPNVDAGADGTLTCLVDELPLGGSGTSTDPGLNYSWTNNATGTEIATTPMFLTMDAGSYTLTVSNPINNCEASASVVIASNIDYPTIAAGTDGLLNCNILSYELGTTGNSTGTEFYYAWTDENGDIVSNDQTYTTSDPGIFTFSILNTDNDCEVEAVINVDQDIQDPLAAAGPDVNFNCVQNTIQLQADLSQTNVTYAWYDANDFLVSSQATHSTTDEGVYTLVVTNADNGCDATDEVAIGTDVAFPIVEAGTSGTITCLVEDIQLGGVNTSQGSEFSYAWTDGSGMVVANTPNYTADQEGTYTLTVVNNDNFCETEASVVVLENTLDPAIALGVGGILDCNVESIVLGDPNTSQGSNFNYNWTLNNVTVGNDLYLEVTDPGNYSLEVTNADNGCAVMDNLMINQDILDPLANAGPDGVFDCDDVTVQLTGSSANTGANIEYAWYNSGGVLVSQDLLAQVDQTDTYTFVVTNTANGCSAEDQAIIEPSIELPNALAEADGLITCTNGSVNLSALNSTTFSGSINFNWLNEAGTSLGNTAQLTTNDPGTYTVEISDPDNGCMASISVEVDQNVTPPTVDAGTDLILDCNSDFLTLLGQAQGSGNLQYTWTDQTGTVIGNNPTQQVSTTGSFSLSVLDMGNGCVNDDAVVVTPDVDAPLADAGPGATLNCILEDFTLDASGSTQGGNIQYTWLDGNQNVLGTGLTYNTSEPGTYYLEVMNTDNGCVTPTNVLLVQDIAIPTPDVIPLSGLTIDCNNPQLVLDASGSLPNGSISFEWIMTDNPTTVISTDPVLELTEPGSYVLNIINTENGCEQDISQLVVENMDTPNLLVADPDEIICDSPEVLISAEDLNNISNTTIAWSSSAVGGIISGGSTFNPLVGQPGIYTLLVTNNETGCTDETSVEVISSQEYPDAVALAEDVLDCVTEVVNISGVGSSEGADFSYSWSGPGIVSGANTISPSVNSIGMYQLEVTNNDNNCKTLADVLVEINDEQPVDLEAKITPPPCAGEPGEIQIQSIEGGTGPYMYGVNGGALTDIPEWQTLLPGTHSVMVEDATGCTYVEELVIPFTDPVQVVLPGALTITLGQNETLNAQPSYPVSQVQSVSWTPSDNLSCSDCLTPIATPTETTKYTVTVIDENGCPATDDILLRIKTKLDIYIPSAFSPNGDANGNDIFHIFASDTENGIDEIESFIIADRWGEIVFKDQNFQPNDPAHGWNGRMGQEGEPMNPGVFVYYAKVKLINGTYQEFEGDVTLIR